MSRANVPGRGGGTKHTKSTSKHDTVYMLTRMRKHGTEYMGVAADSPGGAHNLKLQQGNAK